MTPITLKNNAKVDPYASRQVGDTLHNIKTISDFQCLVRKGDLTTVSTAVIGLTLMDAEIFALRVRTDFTIPTAALSLIS